MGWLLNMEVVETSQHYKHYIAKHYTITCCFLTFCTQVEGIKNLVYALAPSCHFIFCPSGLAHPFTLVPFHPFTFASLCPYTLVALHPFTLVLFHLCIILPLHPCAFHCWILISSHLSPLCPCNFHPCTLVTFHLCILLSLHSRTLSPLNPCVLTLFHPYVLAPLGPFTFAPFYPCTLVTFHLESLCPHTFHPYVLASFTIVPFHHVTFELAGQTSGGRSGSLMILVGGQSADLVISDVIL